MRAAPDGPRGHGTRPAVAMLARSPFVPGKLRLTAGLDAPAAIALRTALLLDTLEAALAPGWPLHVHLDPIADAKRVAAVLRDDAALAAHAARVSWHPQGAGDLGQRMGEAVRLTLGAGHDVAVLVGSDIPDLPRQALVEAHDALNGTSAEARVALGPAEDGGFYLVAATDAALLDKAFDRVAWSLPTVLAEVTARLTAAGVAVARVRTWRDIDGPEALAVLAAAAGEGARRTRQLLRTLPPYNGG